MDCGKALAETFAKFANPRTRSHAVAFLQRYADTSRPITSWSALGEDARAAVALLKALGLEEGRDFTVQTSVLDPEATRIGWTDSGRAALGALPCALPGWTGERTQAAALASKPGDAPVDMPVAAEPAEPDAPAEPDGLVARIAGRTRTILRALAALDVPDGNPELKAASTMARAELAADEPLRYAFPPMALLEAYVRNAAGTPADDTRIPAFWVFDTCRTGCMAARPLRQDESVPVVGRVNCLPLEDQDGESGPLTGYVATCASEWSRFGGARFSRAWIQFDAPVRRSEDALQFALDPDRMAAFATAVLERAFGMSAAMLATSRLAVGNLMDAVPDYDDLIADNDSLGERIENSSQPDDSVEYMAGALLAEAGRLVAPDAGSWAGMAATGPVRTAGTRDGLLKAAKPDGFLSEELADQWFAMIHGYDSPREWLTSMSTSLIGRSYPMCAAMRRQNLAHFRAHMEELRHAPDALLAACSPDNPEFGALQPSGSGPEFTVPGALVNGVCAALRRYVGSHLEFVTDSPHHPDMMVAGVWTGVSTDLSPATAAAAESSGEFPDAVKLTNACAIADGSPVPPAGSADRRRMRKGTTSFLDLLRRRPDVQLRFSKRTLATARTYTFAVETNVRAEKVAAAFRDGAGAKFAEAMWRLVYTCLLKRRARPLAAVDEGFTDFGMDNDRIGPLWDAVRHDCPTYYTAVDADQFSRTRRTGCDVRWAEDGLGRLVLLVSLSGTGLTLTDMLAWRCDMSLPVASAAYLVDRSMGYALMTPGMTPASRYCAVLAAAVRQRGFVSAFARNDTAHSCGSFGPKWMVQLLGDFYCDEPPPRGWYLTGTSLGASVDPAEYWAASADPF